MTRSELLQATLDRCGLRRRGIVPLDRRRGRSRCRGRKAVTSSERSWNRDPRLSPDLASQLVNEDRLEFRDTGLYRGTRCISRQQATAHIRIESNSACFIMELGLF